MVAVAITCSNALRRPEKISGSATGSSTRHSTCCSVIPMPYAASRTSGSTPSTPA